VLVIYQLAKQVCALWGNDQLSTVLHCSIVNTAQPVDVPAVVGGEDDPVGGGNDLTTGVLNLLLGEVLAPLLQRHPRPLADEGIRVTLLRLLDELFA